MESYSSLIPYMYSNSQAMPSIPTQVVSRERTRKHIPSLSQ